MATDEQKKINRLRLTNMTLLSLSTSVWDMLGETSFVFGGDMGTKILNIMEKEMGLEIAGEDPKDVLMEVGRIFVDEFGFASDIEIESIDNNKFEIKVKNCVNRAFTSQLSDAGVEKPFICPIMNSCTAALNRMNYRMHSDVVKWTEGKGSIITFTGV